MAKLSSAKKLSKVEKACIDGMVANNFDVGKIATALDRDVEVINHYLNNKDNEQPSENFTQQSKKEHFYINRTAGGKKGVAISTSTSSERSDEGYRARMAKRNAKQKDYIFKIHNDSDE